MNISFKNQSFLNSNITKIQNKPNFRGKSYIPDEQYIYIPLVWNDETAINNSKESTQERIARKKAELVWDYVTDNSQENIWKRFKFGYDVWNFSNAKRKPVFYRTG